MAPEVARAVSSIHKARASTAGAWQAFGMSIPDVRDGLTRLERVILFELGRATQELGRPSVPTALLYGRVVEHCNVSVETMNAALARLTGRGLAPRPQSAPIPRKLLVRGVKD